MMTRPIRERMLPTMYTEVQSKIIEIRQQKVISDADVADLYGVETKRVNEAVKNKGTIYLLTQKYK